MLPEMGGLDVCRELRSKRIGTPIIMLTAKSQDFDIVLGLELGADDYVTKPFSPFELRARVKAMLRRAGTDAASGSQPVLESGPFRIDEGRYEFYFNDRLVHLTSIEFEIVKTLMGRSGQVVKREDMLNLAWGSDVLVTQRSVDTHISNIRRKIGDDADQPRWIISIRGIGYKLISG
jgi:two-component system alkaline phosphatase synthesis response regulator PhoP